MSITVHSKFLTLTHWFLMFDNCELVCEGWWCLCVSHCHLAHCSLSICLSFCTFVCSYHMLLSLPEWWINVIPTFISPNRSPDSWPDPDPNSLLDPSRSPNPRFLTTLLHYTQVYVCTRRILMNPQLSSAKYSSWVSRMNVSRVLIALCVQPSCLSYHVPWAVHV